MARKTGSHSDITGPKIQAAALHLFAAQGFAAVSMRQIAAEVGVQAGALYNYTPDKQALLFDLMRSHMGDLLAFRQGRGQGAPLERLEEFIRSHIRFHLPRAGAVFISYMELRNLTPENFTIIEAQRHTYEDELESILRNGVRASVFTIPDTKVTTLALIALLNGIFGWYKEDGRLDMPEIETIHWNMVRGAVGA